MNAPSPTRYDVSHEWFRRCGVSGLMLPAISLGCWHNFGGAGTDPRALSEADFHANVQRMLFTAFDHGITHFDLANNYGPPPGSAEERVGTVLRDDLAGYRDELIISSKAGYRMWDGPYGAGSSRKYLLASLDQSLRRLGLDYVDVFYSHCYDEATPLEEMLGALDSAVRVGKALYVGISSYSAEKTNEVIDICNAQGLVRPIIHQPRYSMLDRWVEDGLLETTSSHGLGVIAFCPLAQGLLTDKYLRGIPDASRARQESGALEEERVSNALVRQLQSLNDVAQRRGQSLAQLALAWVLRPHVADATTGPVTSALIGASKPEQIEDCVRALDAGPLADDERSAIEAILARA